MNPSSDSLRNITDVTFLEKVNAYAEVVDSYLERHLTPAPDRQVANLHDGVSYSMGLDVPDRAVRGKRIRPALCLIVAEALGARVEEALPFAAAIELLHNFALVHDDIEDGDTMRRGRPSTWIRYGLPHGINIGDYMLGRVFRLLLLDPVNDEKVKEATLRLLSDTLEDLFAGQALDISARSSRHFTMVDYETLVLRKTGSYLAAPMIGGALIGGLGEQGISALEWFGRCLGPLFQVKDDLIDLTSGKGRGEIGNDIREGKRSFLVAAVTEVCTDQEKIRLYEILDSAREQTTNEMVEETLVLYRKYGVLERAEQYCRELEAESQEAVAVLQEPLRSVLHTAARILTSRST